MPHNDASNAEFCRKMEKLLNAPGESLRGTEFLSGLPNWDSLTILEYMILANFDYAADIEPADIAACKTVDDLADLTLAKSTPVHTGA